MASAGNRHCARCVSALSFPVVFCLCKVTSSLQCSAVAPPEVGKLPPSGWTSKNYVICVCFHRHGTSSYHTTTTKPYKFPMHCSKCVSFWGTSYSRPPIDPYLTPPPRYKILAAPLLQCLCVWSGGGR